MNLQSILCSHMSQPPSRLQPSQCGARSMELNSIRKNTIWKTHVLTHDLLWLADEAILLQWKASLLTRCFRQASAQQLSWELKARESGHPPATPLQPAHRMQFPTPHLQTVRPPKVSRHHLPPALTPAPALAPPCAEFKAGRGEEIKQAQPFTDANF